MRDNPRVSHPMRRVFNYQPCALITLLCECTEELTCLMIWFVVFGSMSHYQKCELRELHVSKSVFVSERKCSERINQIQNAKENVCCTRDNISRLTNNNSSFTYMQHIGRNGKIMYLFRTVLFSGRILSRFSRAIQFLALLAKFANRQLF